MARKKTTDTVVQFGFKLTARERKLLTDAPISLRTGLSKAILGTATSSPVLLSRDAWEEVAEAVAPGANLTRDKRLGKKLHAIYTKIQIVLGENAKAPPPQILKIRDVEQDRQITDQMVQLAEWAAQMLIGTEQLGIKSRIVIRFPLPEAERMVVLMTPTVDEQLRKKLYATNPKLAVGEIGMLISVTEAILNAPPLMGGAMIMTAKSLMNCLESEMKGVMQPAAMSRSIYRLKITLMQIAPPIWRLVDVPDCSLGELHDVIQAAMGWHNSHMHQFFLNGKYYGQAGTDDLDLEVEDEEGIRLGQIFTGKKKPKLIYEYDFGDS